MIANAGGISAAFAVIVVLWIFISIGSIVFLIVALVDIVRRPEWEWKLAGQEKILWVLLVLLVNFLAIPSFIYWFNIRKKLIAVRAAAERGEFGPGQMTFSGWEPNLVHVPPPGSPPAGWYPDPSGAATFRWWDGMRWSGQVWKSGDVAPAGSQPPPPPPAAP
jgi:hypothetical protein